jgi:hypothetical protein
MKRGNWKTFPAFPVRALGFRPTPKSSGSVVEITRRDRRQKSGGKQSEEQTG